MSVVSMPRSLADWRRQAQAHTPETQYEPYDLWRPLISFFQSHGLALWEAPPNYPGWGYQLLEPNGIERAPDGFSYLSQYYPDGSPPEIKDFFQQIVYHHGRTILFSSKLMFVSRCVLESHHMPRANH